MNRQTVGRDSAAWERILVACLMDVAFKSGQTNVKLTFISCRRISCDASKFLLASFDSPGCCCGVHFSSNNEV